MFRKYDKLYYDLKYDGESGIAKKTGCIKPCHYKQYNIIGSGDMAQPSSAGIWLVTNNTFLESEVVLLILLLYPLLGPDLPPDFPGSRVWRHPGSVPGILLHVALGRG